MNKPLTALRVSNVALKFASLILTKVLKNSDKSLTAKKSAVAEAFEPPVIEISRDLGIIQNN